MNRIISSFRRASSICVWAYSVCIIILAVVSYATDWYLSPGNIFILTWMFLCVDILSTIYVSLEGTKKFGSIPYWIRKLIALPFYLGVAIAGFMKLAVPESSYRIKLAVIISVFGIVYFIVSTVRYFIEKKQTDAMTDALIKIQKEIGEKDE